MDGIPNGSNIALVVIDVQEKFSPAIFEFSRVVDNCSKLIRAFQVFKRPILHTEQYPNGLGKTVPELAKLLSGKPIEKTEFSCMRNPEFKKKIEELDVHEIVICGIESHVCVLQTALDAMMLGYEVYLVSDAVSSRKESDWKAGIKRAKQSGAWRVSTEMIIFQMMEKAGTEEFKKIQEIIK